MHGDFLRYRLPRTPHTIVGNLPFHHTTAMLRHILHAEHWTASVLLVQWEVACRCAAVGGATMMTAQWWPWYDFGLAGRVPASAFTPRPGVDAGLMTWDGAAAAAQAQAFQQWRTGAEDVVEGIEAMRQAAADAHDRYSAAIEANLQMLGRR